MFAEKQEGTAVSVRMAWDEEEITKLFRIHRKVLDRLKHRNYLVDASEINMTRKYFVEKFFADNNLNREAMSLKKPKINDDTDQIYVFYIDDEEVTVGTLRRYVRRMADAKVFTSILLLKHRLTLYAKQAISAISDKFHLEVLKEDEILYGTKWKRLIRTKPPKHLPKPPKQPPEVPPELFDNSIDQPSCCYPYSSKKRKKRQQFPKPYKHVIDYIEKTLSAHKLFQGKCSRQISPQLGEWSRDQLQGWKRICTVGDKFCKRKIDLTYVNEFTSFKFHTNDCDCTTLMKLSEHLLSDTIVHFWDSYIIQVPTDGLNKADIMLDFTPPFRRISLIQELEKRANLNIPKDFSSDVTNRYLLDACTKYELKCPPPHTTARLLDKLVKHFVVETCVNPTFIIDYPEVMHPMEKLHRFEAGMTRHFKLFINKHEFCNGYVAFHDPVVYREFFLEQVKDHQSGDEELRDLDETSGMTSECELPPTGCWGLAIDRIIVLITKWDRYRN